MSIQTSPPGAAPPGSADHAAPLDALIADAALGTFRQFTPDASAVKLAAALARGQLRLGRMTGMNDLLKLAIDGHGGMRRWEQLSRFRFVAIDITDVAFSLGAHPCAGCYAALSAAGP